VVSQSVWADVSCRAVCCSPVVMHMDDKKSYEAFRLRQFAQPHPALQAAQSAADTQALEDVEPDRNRIILHFDCDCWYAQGRGA